MSVVETAEQALTQFQSKSSVQEKQQFLLLLKSTKPRLFRRLDGKDIKKLFHVPMPLYLSLTDSPTSIEDHNPFPLDDKLNPYIALITIGSELDRLDENVRSYLKEAEIDHRLIFPIVIKLEDADKEGDQFNSFIEQVILSLIDKYPDILIQFKCVSYKLTSSKYYLNGLFFTSNDENAEQIRECVKMEYENAKSFVWLITKGQHPVYKDDDGHQFKTLKKVLEHLKVVYGDYTIGTATEDPNWLTTNYKTYNVSLTIKDLNRSGGEIVIVEKKILDISKRETDLIFEYLQSYSIIEDSYAICDSQNGDYSFRVHPLILKHLQISSISESIKRFTGLRELKSCDQCDDLVWQTAFVVTYLEHVLAKNKSEWESASQNAREWIHGELGERGVNELFTACFYYLVEVGAYVYNKQEKMEVIEIVVDKDTEKSIYENLVENASDYNGNDLYKTQSDDGYFTCDKIVNGEFSILFTDKTIDSLKRYASSIGLKRTGKTVWVTAFVICYFENILTDRKHEWNSAHNLAKRWILKRINGKLEKDLFHACKQFLTKKGCEFLTGDY